MFTSDLPLIVEKYELFMFHKLVLINEETKNLPNINYIFLLHLNALLIFVLALINTFD